MALIPEFQAVFESKRDVALETKVFRFVVNAEQKFTFQPGQFVSLKIQEKVFRAYSISSSPAELPAFETCVKLIPDGVGSTYLENLKPGALITFRGAFGHFTIKHPAKDKLFIATGTGISPIRSFVKEIQTENLNGQHELVFGVRTVAYAAYLEEFRKLSETHEHFAFTLCVSQPDSKKPGAGSREPEVEEKDSGFRIQDSGFRIQDPGFLIGRVTNWAAEQTPEYFDGKDIYICGSPPMVKEMTKLLTEEKGVTKEQIHTEAY